MAVVRGKGKENLHCGMNKTEGTKLETKHINGQKRKKNKVLTMYLKRVNLTQKTGKEG